MAHSNGNDKKINQTEFSNGAHKCERGAIKIGVKKLQTECQAGKEIN